ncbi:two-partner secretion domain-containing protein [Fischerella sp. PCC 9605]|uniref:two-partner secretion domain-containing protein n=1 Tax=Fischerella sp. PCC 9605 TaxID=1173024 RepID=UPI00047D93CB|nr:filamentous hemagglutinin N-terminal domain-containing protein [Fischerella sp. PCC 9605]
MKQLRHRFLLFTLPVAILETLAFITIAKAQISPDNSLGAESSIVNPDVIKGIPSDRIDGGAIRGSNLFHSFQEFNVGEGRGAYFSNPANITNILTRVTGGNPSNILGKLGVLGGNANLFLLNPKGIFFWANASLDLGGSFFGTTADSFIFNNNFEFSATNPQAPPLLTINIPIGLRFRNNPGTIASQSIARDANNNLVGLQVQPGNSLALVGGNINLSDGGRLTATGGSIELGGLATPGTVGLDITGNRFKLNFPSNSLLSDITLSNARVQNNLFSGTTGTAGDINVTTNNLSLINGGQISASTSGQGNAGKVTVNATGNIFVSGENTNTDYRRYGGIFSVVNANAQGNSGDIQITSKDISLADKARIDTSTQGKGDAGGIQINTKDLSLTNGGLINATTYKTGNAGKIIINAIGNISVSGENNDGNRSGVYSGVDENAVGNAGGIEIKTNNISLVNGGLINASTLGNGNAGRIIINATGNISADGENNDGNNSGIFSQVDENAQGDAGGIAINTKDLSLTNGAQINARTFGKGNAGSVIINATGNISVDGKDKQGFISGILSSVGSSGIGNAGGLEIKTNNLSLTDDGGISASTFGKGNAGIVKINATGNISVDGFGSLISSEVNRRSQGNSGGIEINTNNLSLTDGAEISASTFGKGNAGIVKINATGNISLDSTVSQINSETFSIGNAGNVEINTNNLSLTDGAEISASTRGEGNAGTVKINATGNISVDGPSEIASNTFGVGNAGNVEINTNNLSLTDGAEINVNTGGEGNAGTVKINATGNISVDGFGSEISSTVRQFLDAVGNAGGIQINTKNLSLTNGGQINVSTSGKGNAGSVIINATGNISADGEGEGRFRRFRSGIFSTIDQNAQGDAGGIEIKTNNLSLTDGGIISASTLGKGNAGRVIINATGNISADGEDKQGFVSGIFSAVAQNAEGSSDGIQINTKDLSLTDGGIISASTDGKGNAGSVIVNATGNISADGENKKGSSSGIYSGIAQNAEGSSDGIQINTKDLSLTDGGIISASTFGKGNAGSVIVNATGNISVEGEDKQGFGSGIFSQVNENAQGDAGGIKIKTNNLSLTDGGIISASTFGKGNAGRVIINATGNISADGEDKQGFGSGLFSQVNENAQGDAGGIKINGRSLSLSNGATLTTDSLGTGAAGNIEVTTAKDIRLDNRASITANTTGGQGNIILNSRDLILRRNSNITTNATGTATGGNITINTGNFVALENSDISANAEESFGGRVFITAEAIFGTKFRERLTPKSDITATSKLGSQFSGTVQINTPDVDPSQGLTELPENVADPSSQIAQNPCQKGSGSAFIVTGRGGLPSSPNQSFKSDNVRVDLVEAATSNSNSPIATITHAETSPDTKQIVPARGWVFNEKGEVVLTAYDPTSTAFQRSRKNPAACSAF